MTGSPFIPPGPAMTENTAVGPWLHAAAGGWWYPAVAFLVFALAVTAAVRSGARGPDVWTFPSAGGLGLLLAPPAGQLVLGDRLAVGFWWQCAAFACVAGLGVAVLSGYLHRNGAAR